MIKNKILSCLFLLVFFLNQTHAITFKFGKSGKIIYDLKTGTFNAWLNSEEFLKNGFSSFKEHNKSYNSKDYLQRNYSSIRISNQFGKGVKHIIELKNKSFFTWVYIAICYGCHL